MAQLTRLTADRRLYVTDDRSRIVEEADPAGSWLLYAVGKVIGAGDIALYSMTADEFGRVLYNGCPALPKLEKPEPPPSKKSKKDAETSGDETESAGSETESSGAETETSNTETEGAEDEAGDSDRNREEPLEQWTGRTGPDAYIRRYPDGPRADLARAHIVARDNGADGGS